MICLIGAGGTGGHLYPGIAVAQVLCQRGWTVAFVLTRGDRGGAILERSGFSSQVLAAPRLSRRPSWDWVPLPWRLGQGFFTARQMLKRLRPQVVLGMGGYVSFPLVIAARAMGIPTVIHEQNAVPGLANRWLSHVVTRIAISFPETLPVFPVGEVVVTGCPIRQPIGGVERTVALRFFRLSENRLTGLVMGGSLGAHRLNKLLTQALPAIIGLRDQLQWIHLAGAQDVDAVERAYREGNWSHRAVTYLDEVAYAYAASDFAIARAGGSTIAELMASALPTLLVPYPYATNDHQFANAQPMSRGGVATVMREAELTPQRLAEWVRRIVADTAYRHQLKARALTFKPSEPSAAESLASLVATFNPLSPQ
ncbi:MAG: undecaprenyldiphospho-muramoylpentapeptide beta-N-acetylglucosaminyltransferase [Elusimicrobia bacterium]|nr:undecaprenyldiphospho-muramoylpentapeptide beta-N-acetylglucosaminyltransferase [Elusimicrobiota bacterium]